MEAKGDFKLISLEDLKEMGHKLEIALAPNGFECYPFKIGWYNEHVSTSFKLPYSSETLAFVVISSPSMFEKSFIPFVSDFDCSKFSQDPLDQCMMQKLSEIKKIFPQENILMIHDFELTSSRRPKILVQTAGHVSGAVRFYQRKDLKSDPWDVKKKIFGVCLHPNYGGWFALRGVAIFTSIICPELEAQEPRNILQNDEELLELLKLYNENWKDWKFRDVIPVKECYSEIQKEYFNTNPGDRGPLIERYCAAESKHD